MVVKSVEQLLETIEKDMKRRQIIARNVEMKAGISSATLSHWFSGRNHPRMDPLLIVLDILGLELHLERKVTRPK